VARRKRREPETARVAAVTHDGRGIVTTEGKKVFVAGALEGETVTYLRRKFRRNFDEAELLEIHEASPDRIAARCAAYDRCGGCSLQHVSIDHQRDIKEQTLRDNMERIGRVVPDAWLAPMTGPVWHYRRRARLAVKDVKGKGRALVGFRERHAPFIADMHRCEVLVEPLDAMIADLSDLIGGLTIRARLPQVEVAVADNDIALVFRVLDPPTEEDKTAFRAFGEQHGLRVYLQPGGLDTVTLLFPDRVDESLYYALPEFDFCGIGNFSLPLARYAGSVLGVEGLDILTARASANAERNRLDNVSFRVADLSKIDGSEKWVRAGCDRMLLDPARSGAHEVVSRMNLFGPQRIVYVSCHPGTLARDAGTLVHEQDYRLESAGIIDMFPHTAHVESIAVFTKA
jgi:23S rRNA (uracil1939-C5)-methyltransferase